MKWYRRLAASNYWAKGKRNRNHGQNTFARLFMLYVEYVLCFSSIDFVQDPILFHLYLLRVPDGTVPYFKRIWL